MRADVLTADAAEAFSSAPVGIYEKALDKPLVDNRFSLRNAVEAADAYHAFRGRNAKMAPLMHDRAFPVPEAKLQLNSNS